MRINEEVAAGREAGERHLSDLERAYVSAIRAAGREAAERFSARVTVVAAATPTWVPPDVSDVMAFAVRGDRIRAQQRRMLGTIGGRVTEIPGVSFDALAPPAQRMLDAVAKRAVMQAHDIRQPVGDAITKGWAEGKSVPDVAKDIRSAVNGLAPFRATALARTDLIALSNGAGHEAVQQLNGAARDAGEPPPVRSKTWLSAGDDRVRPTHAEADGQNVPIDQPFNVGGEDLMYPGDPAGSDEECMQCRCTELYEETGAGVPAGEEPVAQETFADKTAMPNPMFLGSEMTNELNVVVQALSRMPVSRAAREKMEHLKGGMLPVKTPLSLGEGTGGEFARMRKPGLKPGEPETHVPQELRVATGSATPGVNFLHEYGHFLDNVAFDAPIYGSHTASSAGWARLRAAFESSPEVQMLREKLALRTTQRDTAMRARDDALARGLARSVSHLEYLLRPQEVFARAFAQWTARRYGGRLLQKEMAAKLQRQQFDPHAYVDQWHPDNFGDVSAAMEALLREARIIGEEFAVKALVLKRPLTRVVRTQPSLRGFLRHALIPHEKRDNLVVAKTGFPSDQDVDGHASDSSAARRPPRPDVPSEVTRGGQMAVVEQEQAVGTKWVSDIAFEGLSTGDGRFMVPGSLGWRDLPLTLMAMIETPEFGGHGGAQVAGRMDTMEKDGKADMNGKALSKGVTAVRSTGVFDEEGDRGSETARMVDDETMRGISIDLAVHEWAFRDPETGELIDPEEATDADWERAFMGELEFAVIDGEIMAATVCPTPAFADARIAILASSYVRPRVWIASAEGAAELGVPAGQLMTTLVASAVLVDEQPRVKVGPLHIVAGAAPIAAPGSWFARPEPNGPQAIQITDEGELYGHIALWDTCHTGFINGQWSQCIKAPHSQSGYANFHLGQYVTAEGDLIDIGTFTFDTGHAPINLGRVAARAHYDDSGSVGAFVRALDGEFGIWICGALPADLTPEQLARLRACPPSGDWRSADHNLELIATLAVPTPGFPVPRSQLALSLAASGDVEVTALILTASVFDTDVFGGVQIPVESYEYEGAALDAVIANGADGLAALIEGA